MAARHATVDQRELVPNPMLAGRLHALNLVPRNADVLRREDLPRRALPLRQADKLAHLPGDRLNLELAGTLAPETPFLGVDRPLSEERRSGEAPAVDALDDVPLEPVVLHDSIDGEGKLRLEPRQPLVHCDRLRSGVGEYGAVRHRLNLAQREHERDRRTLDAGPERYHVQHR